MFAKKLCVTCGKIVYKRSFAEHVVVSDEKIQRNEHPLPQVLYRYYRLGVWVELSCLNVNIFKPIHNTNNTDE